MKMMDVPLLYELCHWFSERLNNGNEHFVKLLIFESNN